VHTFFRRYFPNYDESKSLHRALVWVFSSRSPIAKLSALVAVAMLLFFFASYVLTQRIFPNVYAMGLPLAELSAVEAEEKLHAHWGANVRIAIHVDGQPIETVLPEKLGLSLDAASMAEAAVDARFAAIPFGATIAPALHFDHSRAQTLLLDLSELIYVPQIEAGYQWSGGRLTAVPGKRGRHLDIKQNMDKIRADAAAIVLEQRFDLQTIPLEPVMLDSEPFLDEAFIYLSKGLQLRGYDPFKNETLRFNLDDHTAASWIIAGENGLKVRSDTFSEYIAAVNRDLLPGGRYVDKLLAEQTLQAALTAQSNNVYLRLNYLPAEYEIQVKDTGYRIGRKRGLPYELIRDANPTVNWNSLVVGQRVQIPSRDVMISAKPVPHKRIIVDLESQWLVAFENNQRVFDWAISSGREEAPTYPGIFQILTHDETAFGGSFALCNDEGTNCNQWEMAWFMGIYEVVPGLMNGFHGAVLLPNGNYLGGGGVYEPTTFGCIMSQDSRAKELFYWAETGTMVEIVSDEFYPESGLAREALAYISSIDTNYRPITF